MPFVSSGIVGMNCSPERGPAVPHVAQGLVLLPSTSCFLEKILNTKNAKCAKPERPPLLILFVNFACFVVFFFDCGLPAEA